MMEKLVNSKSYAQTKERPLTMAYTEQIRTEEFSWFGGRKNVAS